MIITNLDYLTPVADANARQLTGGALAISSFSATALGRSTFAGTVLRNFARVTPDDSEAYSSVQVVAIATGGNAFASASASSFASS